MSLTSVELFAGIGGFRIACDNLGIRTVWANDIEEKASQVYRDNFGSDVFHEGDIWELYEKIPEHDLLTAGFPCQPFSSAGKKLGIKDPRGTLFQAIIEILKKKSPKYFVLENVKRLLSMDSGKHFATILNYLSSLGYLIEWKILNALDFGLPQNRERIVIIGTKNGALPKSFLLTKNDAEYLKPSVINNYRHPERWENIMQHGKCFDNWGLAIDGTFISSNLPFKRYRKINISLKDVLEKEVGDEFDFTEDTKERIQYSVKVDKYVNGVEIKYNQGGGARMGYTVFGVSGIAPTLTSSTSRHYERYQINGRFRRLTNVEYARLQGFPDNHCKIVSKYNQYSLFGNAFPPPMAEWVIKRLVHGISEEITANN